MARSLRHLSNSVWTLRALTSGLMQRIALRRVVDAAHTLGRSGLAALRSQKQLLRLLPPRQRGAGDRRTIAAAAALVAAGGCCVASAAHCESQQPPAAGAAEPALSRLYAWLLGPSAAKQDRARLRSIKTERRGMIRCAGGEAELARDYEILDFLGRGGFGTVQRARHRTTGLIRAVKKIPCSHEEGQPPTAEQWAKLFVEVEALMELVHPNIVRLHEYYQSSDALYLVEEFCSGGTLEQRLKQRGGRLEPQEAAVVLRHMLRGILCCHAHGLAHRDLKLDNYVFASTRETAALKLIDFGLSITRPLGTVDSDVPLAYVQAGGMLEHTAPETLPQRDAEGRVTKGAYYAPPADMWSLGTLLFHLLTGEPLVGLDEERTSTAEFDRMMRGLAGQERDLLDDAALKIRSEEFIGKRMKLIREGRRRAPPEAVELLEQMLAQDPAKRVTATQALKHAFVAQSYVHTPRGRRVFDVNIVEKMRTFAEAPALRRFALLIEAHMLGPQDDDDVRLEVLTFRSADSRDDGKLTVDDITKALRAQGLEVPHDLESIWQRCGFTGEEGCVNLIEFVAATMEPRVFVEPRLFRAAFRVLDADGDGWITQPDLESMLMESPQRSETARAILQSAAPDERGRVNFATFCDVMLPKGVDPSLAERVSDYISESFV